MAETQDRLRSSVVLLSLEKPSYFDEMYGSLLAQLRSEADTTEITDPSLASSAFDESRNHSKFVLATDAALAREGNARQLAEAVRFVRTGGVLIFALGFSSLTRPQDIGRIFQAFGLAWQSGDYHRTELELNPAFRGFATEGLVKRYSQKAVHLKNVETQSAIYLPTSSSRIQSRVFSVSPIEDLNQTPAAYSTCERGKIGYLGDVNAEEETDKVILAFCGLLQRQTLPKAPTVLSGLF